MDHKPPTTEENRERSPIEAKKSRWGFSEMTVREWLDLLIVPVVLVIIGSLITVYQDARQQAREDRRAKADQTLAEQRAQDLTLQAYLDQMSTLVLEDLSNPKVRTVARARTLTALRTLDPSRKEEVMRFLLEADLVKSVGESKPVIELGGADLCGTDLKKKANLSGNDLSDANLYDVALKSAHLSGVKLSGADLSGADLSGANLRKVEGITNEELDQQASLNGATMPNGQKYEDWLKDREGHGKDGESPDPS